MTKEDNNPKDDISSALKKLEKVKAQETHLEEDNPKPTIIEDNPKPTIIKDYIVSVLELNPETSFYTLMEQFLEMENKKYSENKYHSRKLKNINSGIDTLNSLLASIDVSLHIHNLIKLWKYDLISDEYFTTEIQKLSKIKIDIDDDSIWEY